MLFCLYFYLFVVKSCGFSNQWLLQKFSIISRHRVLAQQHFLHWDCICHSLYLFRLGPGYFMVHHVSLKSTTLFLWVQIIESIFLRGLWISLLLGIRIIIRVILSIKLKKEQQPCFAFLVRRFRLFLLSWSFLSPMLYLSITIFMRVIYCSQYLFWLSFWF